ncbi:MAG: methyltransferase domain-containing protein [Rhodomicrobium sp.]|nr:methyltransferase domain-containing protein [Rhodomicrobium sp.]
MTSVNAPLSLQQDFWNSWNARTREQTIDVVSIEQSALVRDWLARLGRRDLSIIDIGCGAGWLSGQLTGFGTVVGTDLSDEVLARSAERWPAVKFVAGDFMTLDFGAESFDAAVSLEVLSHVADQPAFIRKIASLLKPGGHFIIATQNKPALMRNDIPAPAPGQLRRWVDRHELTGLLQAEFEVIELCSITPLFNRGLLRRLNGHRANRLASKLKLAGLKKRVQERLWLGWTLMAMARKPL